MSLKRNLFERHKNYLMNGEFRFFQRQIPATQTNYQDDAYGPDRWNILTSGGAVNVGVKRDTALATTGYDFTKNNGYILQNNGTSRQWGMCQIIESQYCQNLRGKDVTFSALLSADSSLCTHLRLGIIEWTGTADAVTSDVVSSWASTPTLASSLTFINTPASINMTTSFVQSTVTVTLGTSFTNLIIFVWCPDSVAQGGYFQITQTQLVQGRQAHPWSLIQLSPEDDLKNCQRYYNNSHTLDQAPSAAESANAPIASNVASGSANTCYFNHYFPVEMRAAPSIVIRNPSTGDPGEMRESATANIAVTTVNVGTKRVSVKNTAGTSTASTNYSLIHVIADAEL